MSLSSCNGVASSVNTLILGSVQCERSSAAEHRLHTAGAVGSIPTARTIFMRLRGVHQMKESNPIRNVQADIARVELFKSKMGLLGMLFSEEAKVILRYIRPYFLKMLPLVIAVAVASFMEAGRTIALIGLMKLLVLRESAEALSLPGLQRLGLQDWVQSLSYSSTLTLMLVGVLGFSALMLALRYWSSLKTQDFQLELYRVIRLEILERILRADLNTMSETKSGEVLFMIGAETSRFMNVLVSLRTLFSAGITLVIFLGLLFAISPGVTALLFVTGGVFFVIQQFMGRKLKMYSWEANRRQNLMMQKVYEIIYGLKLIRVGGTQEREIAYFKKQSADFEAINRKNIGFRSKMDVIRESLTIVLLASACAFLALGLGSSAPISSGDALAYLLLLMRCLPSTTEIQQNLLNTLESYGPLKKIAAFLKEPLPENKLTGKEVVLNEIPRLDVREVSYQYPGRESGVTGVDLRFERGKLYALVGFSGSGKSTMLDLLIGVRSPTAGGVFYDGCPVANLHPQTMRERVSYMNQEPIVFYDSLRENVRYFRPQATDAEVWAALEAAQLKEFVEALPEGLDTLLGERGLNVSGGEKQRIGLARVLLCNPDVLLLDEATNSLDFRTETRVYESLKSARARRITIVVAHRLNTIIDFDQIIVFNQGRAVEQGSHDELMAREGVYANLYRYQQIHGDSPAHEA